MPAAPTGPPKYSFDEIRAKAIERLGYHPCLWQIKVVEAILKRDGDVVCIAATGSGKTLTFWLPLLFRTGGIQLVISPLNILGQQNVAQLAGMNIQGITITGETATPRNFQDIEDGKYSVVATNVETLMQQDGGFERLWKKPDFTSRLISLVWDEGHCASTWAGFRPEYKHVSRLRFLIPRDIPFLIVSATLPPAVLSDVMHNLQVSPKKCTIIRRSNDRPNIHLVVREMKYSMSSYKDLAFLIPEDWKPGDPLPSKFLIFFDSIADSIEAAKFLRARLPPEYRHKIKWFNSEMSSEFKDLESDALKSGQIWGLSCTDSFGMGLDLPDILLVIQWRSTCDMCTLWQRLGRAARALNLTATGLFLVEPKRFDANIEKAEARAAKRAASSKKRKEAADALEQSPAKRIAVTAAADTHRPVSVPVVAPSPTAAAIAGDLAEQQPPSPTDGGVPLAPSAAAFASLTPSTSTSAAEDSAAPADLAPDIGSNSTTVGPSSAMYKLDRRAVYDAVAHPTPQWKKQTKKKGADRIEPALDDFINASTRQPGAPCLRLPVTIYFGNDTTTSDHLLCRPDLQGGCTRCKVAPADVCCELCTPDKFIDFAHVDLPKTKPQPKRSSIADYKAEPADFALKADLQAFRTARMLELRGRAHLRSFGASYIMPDDVLNRIVDCAHFNKILTSDDLLKETRWHRVSADGDTVLTLIRQHHPPPPPPNLITTPLRPSNSHNLSSSSTKAPRQCGNCGQYGHISSNRKCPKHVPKATPARRNPRNENSPTSSSTPTPAFTFSAGTFALPAPFSTPPETPVTLRPQPKPLYRGTGLTNTPTIPSSLSLSFTPAPATTSTDTSSVSPFPAIPFPNPVMPPLVSPTPSTSHSNTSVVPNTPPTKSRARPNSLLSPEHFY
ncbi:P-loop containing nucleoside triphosphate hydrolase protein [Mycena vitilis]|nr:P-loop containing nucleoside triphosphate hydrolase protein [Mycena vitilis]